jgi:hypothetical protein
VFERRGPSKRDLQSSMSGALMPAAMVLFRESRVRIDVDVVGAKVQFLGNILFQKRKTRGLVPTLGVSQFPSFKRHYEKSLCGL